ncbi:hypothetical protein C9994_16100 [Marivirga lumbricoides]|uniref:Uncharacterized protein n=1 Tax=Marivirga lumbricoides TaxID=1046115 RepID=A0A2T4DBC2_9BACT|nr:hypothetical protein C9994_16100 [Marivirga lumbricoides]
MSKEMLIAMLSMNQHPTLKRIRIQLLVESTAWILFLALYYNLFDGDQKPVFWNIAFIISVGLMLVHNFLGYQVIGNPVKGTNIAQSLKLYLLKLKKYAYLSVSARVFSLCMLLGYFLSGIEVLEQRYYVSIIVFGLITIIQAIVLWRIWAKRIQIISSKYQQLTS